MDTWASLHNSVFIYLTYRKNLKKKEGDIGFVLPVSSSIAHNWADCLLLSDKDFQGPQLSLQSRFGALSRQKRCEALLINLAFTRILLSGWTSSYILILNQTKGQTSWQVEKNKVIKNLWERYEIVPWTLFYKIKNSGWLLISFNTFKKSYF